MYVSILGNSSLMNIFLYQIVWWYYYRYLQDRDLTFVENSLNKNAQGIA